jgi:hypothetical protein
MPPLIIMSCADLHSPQELEKLANEILAGSLRGTSTEAHAMTVQYASLTTSREAPGQMIFGGLSTILPTSVIAWKTRFLTETSTWLARLCVSQAMIAGRPLVAGCYSPKLCQSGNSLIFGCCLAGHLGCVVAIVQKSMPAVGITVLWSRHCRYILSVTRPFSPHPQFL